MKQENISKTMTVNHLEDGPPFTTIQLILWILIATVFVGSILYLYPIHFMGSGGQIDHFIKLPVQSCQPSDALVLPRSIIELQNDYLICLKKVMKQ